MPADNMPAAEVDIDEALVRALLDSQHPDLAALPIVALGSGWDNVLYRLGDDLLVRLPRRALAADLVAHEQRWLPELAPRLPLPIPAPVRTGRPELGYPWSWSVCPWFPGDAALHRPPDDLALTARTLGAFLVALHQPAADDAPVNPFRGVALADRSETLAERAEQLRSVIDAESVRARWDALVRTTAWPGPPMWLHGDLHPGNLVVHDGALSAVVDFGDVCAGDPATDLSVAWMLFSSKLRPAFRAAAGTADDDTWARAQAWALSLALAYLANSADNPAFERLGHATLAAVLADPL